MKITPSPAFFGTLDALRIAWFFDENEGLMVEEDLPPYFYDLMDTYDESTIPRFPQEEA